MRNRLRLAGFCLAVCWPALAGAATPPPQNKIAADAITALADSALNIEDRGDRWRALSYSLSSIDVIWNPAAEAESEPRSLSPATAGTPAAPQLVPLELLQSVAGFPKDRAFFATLVAAQPSPAKIVVLSAGTHSLTSLAKDLTAQGRLDLISVQDSAFTINVPIYVGAGAILEIGSEASVAVKLNSFLVSAGRLAITNAAIDGGPVARQRPDAEPALRPFILVGTSGSIEARGSKFTRLGDGSKYSAGIIVLGAEANPSIIADNLLEDSYGIRVDDAANVVIARNELRGIFGAGILVSGSADVEVTANLIHRGANERGIVLSESSTAVRVTGNLVARNAAGITVTSGSAKNIIAENVVLGNHGVGIGLYGGSCNLVQANAVIANRDDAITWREGTASIIGNRLDLNGRAGVSSPRRLAEKRASGLLLKDNMIARNRVGLMIDQAAWLDFENNSFKLQSPRILSGAIKAQLGEFLRHGSERVVFVAHPKHGFMTQAARPVDGCGKAARN